jgi:hypothetical protein
MAKDTPTPTPESSPEAQGSTASPNPEPVNLALTDTPPALAIGDSAPAEQPSGDPKADLATLAQNGNTNRLSPADEDKATRLMRDCLLEGGDGTAAALAAMPLLPWILGVRAIEAAWQQITPEARAAVLDGLAKMDTDNGYRLRLSMARSLARAELSEGAKVAAAACRSMWDAQAGSLKAEHSKLIGNVFIGRGKPWVLQLNLADMPAEDATAILSAVVFSTFNVNNAPITQLSVLRYGGSRLASLHENLIGMIARAVGRWNGKWQSALRKEVTELPEAILATMKPDRGPEPKGRSADETPAAAAETPEAPVPDELQEKLRVAAESEDPAAVEAVNQEIAAWREAEKIARLEALDADDEDEDEDEADEDEDEDEPAEVSDAGGGRRRRGRNDRKERPAYVPRDQERGQERGHSSGFNFSATLKQLEGYVSGLRNDLATAQNRLRRAESEGPKSRPERPVLSHEEANLSPDELKRLVIQLEGRIAELNGRVEELTTDSEARALAMAAGSGDAAPDATTQLRTLLALKLQEDYADFLALQKESPDAIVQQHYRGLINHVFDVLRGEQIPLTVPHEPVVEPPLPPAFAP